MIPFNKPYLHGNELGYIAEAVASGKISGDGIFTRKCQDFFEKKYDFKKTFLTTSCTDALEMAALLLEIKQGDEVILPSFTFVSTANAFALRGAKLIFADSASINPNIDPAKIESLVAPATKVIVLVHYAGIACNMEPILEIAKKYNVHIVEDAAQAVDSYYLDKPLGSFGVFSTFSFHETKNIISGEGGMLVVNNFEYIKKAEIIRDKGTNRSAFFRGEVDKYNWVDIGSSFLPSEIVTAYLYAQLQVLDVIQSRRINIWKRYMSGLGEFLSAKGVGIPYIPKWSTNNGHIFYIVCRSIDERSNLILHLKNSNVMAVFHYQSLHISSYFKNLHDGRILENSDRYSDCLVRLPLYYEMSDEDVDKVIDLVCDFYF